ncbi:type 2 isopentenyl-diphosphate Delta-isomerase [Hazenella sp. IB182353]|uniref:type 2 isopentenyl-diphosphate Delta-isomerase n=1 Tax=Polycladospora coralii TaxID=2771432 RepID=UPI001745D54D|nr:type 2 isopentenyl-diphosphate Delta-isomerase [Polycladospora coralii]MBS7531947.1 type 2 isopentenyl-diphosphate Delta-isomerase [Polycladospora coralii]
MSREKRKLDHIHLAMEESTSVQSHFDLIRLIHLSLPEVNLAETNLSTSISGVPLHSPIFINAMTGGAKSVKEINRKLAHVAKETGIAMAVGSQRAALQKPELWETFQVVRDVNPKGVVIANLGADSTWDDVGQAIDMLKADILQLHLNVPQELVMPEGDRSFVGILQNIATLVDRVNIPVIVKETGFGMCRETYHQLIDIGVQIVDVSGGGGTDFIAIENKRRTQSDYSHLQAWGQSTAISLLESLSCQDQLTVLSSGGIRNTLDIAKSLALGAQAVGIAGLFLRILQTEGMTALIQYIQSWHQQLHTIMTMLGIRELAAFKHVPLVVQGELTNWCKARQIDWRGLANRHLQS